MFVKYSHSFNCCKSSSFCFRSRTVVQNLNSLEPTSRLQTLNRAVIEFLIPFPILNLFVVFRPLCVCVLILQPVLKHSQWDIRLHTEEEEDEYKRNFKIQFCYCFSTTDKQNRVRNNNQAHHYRLIYYLGQNLKF